MVVIITKKKKNAQKELKYNREDWKGERLGNMMLTPSRKKNAVKGVVTDCDI